jgi:3-deoxy-D-manno-octulosonic-acid transferase
MSHFLYNLSLIFYRIILHIVSTFNPKARKLIDSKKLWRNGLEKLGPKKYSRIWFHSASLGEFEQGRPIIESLKSNFPDISIVITFFSPSGYEVRKDYKCADIVLYLPWDTKSNASEFFDSVEPDITIFIKYEFWRHFLEESSKRKIPSILISGIFRPTQLFFKSYGESYRKILDCFDHLFLQNQQSIDLLSSIDVTNTTLAGDTRFDRVKSIVTDAERVDIASTFKNDEKIFIAGSVWKEDLEVIIPIINDSEVHLKYIIAPHEIDKGEIEAWRSKLQSDSVLFSETRDVQSLASERIMIIDNVGILSRLYRYGDFAFIGGAYGPGLHNTLEAITFGMPVFFGNKNYKKYQEALDLIEARVGYPIETSSVLKGLLIKFGSHQDEYNEVCKKATTYIDSKTGASEMILDYISDKIK